MPPPLGALQSFTVALVMFTVTPEEIPKPATRAPLSLTLAAAGPPRETQYSSKTESAQPIHTGLQDLINALEHLIPVLDRFDISGHGYSGGRKFLEIVREKGKPLNQVLVL